MDHITAAVPVKQYCGESESVDARDVFRFLEVNTTFSSWIAQQIRDCLLTEKEDYEVAQDGAYYLSVDAAKQIMILDESYRGREVRKYFIECERIARMDPASSAFTQNWIEHYERWRKPVVKDEKWLAYVIGE